MLSAARRFISYRRAYLILFVVLPFLAFPEIIFGGQTLYWTDLSWIHFPRHIFAADEWLAGRVPLWDPYEDTGLPLLAESQVGVLYPPSLIFLTPFSPSLELSLFILLHFTLAAIFTHRLARSLGMGRAGAVVSGLAFGLGGFLMAQTPNLNIMTGAVWLPLILYAARQTVERRQWPVAILAGIPVALQIFTAQPQIVFYTWVIVIGYGLYMAFHRPNLFRSGGWLLAMLLSGLLLAAPQLLPTLELQQLSTRSAERDFEFLTENSLPPAMFLNLAVPGAYGNNVTGFRGGDPFQEDFVYAGFIPLLLAFLAWGYAARRQEMGFFYLLLFGGAMMALGKYTPLYRYVIQYLPGFALFRIPARWLMAVNLALAILAGFGLEAIRRRGISRRTLGTIWLAGLLLAGSLALIWHYKTALLPLILEWPQPYQKLAEAFLQKGFAVQPVYRDRLIMGHLAGLTAPAFLLFANLGAVLLLLTLYAFDRLSGRIFAGLLIVAVSVDLVAAGGTTINPLKPAEWWGQLSGGAAYVLTHLEDNRVFPLGMGSEEAAVSHLGHYFPSVYGVRSAGGHGSSLRMGRYDTFLHEADPVQAIQVLGVRYLLTLGRMGEDAAHAYPIVYSDEDSFVYENKNPLPRAFVVYQAIAAADAAEALTYFQGRSIDPARTVILEGAAPPLPGPAAASGPEAARISREHAQQVEIEVSLERDGYLVLLDSYYPGWRATIDGRRTPIYRANYIGRAVFVPAGVHRVRFVYRPLSFWGGVGLALAVMIGFGVGQLRERRLFR